MRHTDGHWLSSPKIRWVRVVQAQPLDDDDPTSSYMLQAGARICKCLGEEFLPYMQVCPGFRFGAYAPAQSVVHAPECFQCDTLPERIIRLSVVIKPIKPLPPRILGFRVLKITLRSKDAFRAPGSCHALGFG